MDTFEQFNLAPDLLRAIAKAGYQQPTPIQASSIPVILSNQDVMGAAQTGTGKTAAFMLPIIQKLLPLANSSTSPAKHPLRALVLVPTRELADQVADNAALYSQFTSLRTAVVYGGVSIDTQIEILRKGVEILIATPGRLLDHLSTGVIKLSQVQCLVLDEADRMLDMGFLPDLTKILSLLPSQRQTLLFSATFSPEIKKLSARFLNNPTVIEVAKENSTAETISQTVYAVLSRQKVNAVMHLLKQRKQDGLPEQCVVFCNSKIQVDRLVRKLVEQGFEAEGIHGDKNQHERTQILTQFKQSQINILVATDVAARGLDIPQMPCVINFDLPYNAEDYVHRIGRTGRAGAKGEAISIMATDDVAEKRFCEDIEKFIKKKLLVRELVGFELTTTSLPSGEVHSSDERRLRNEIRQAKESAVVHRRRNVNEGKLALGLSKDPFFFEPYQSKKQSEQLMSHNGKMLVRSPKVKKRSLGLLLGEKKTQTT